VFGNTHYPMADKNNAEVFRVVSQWLKGEKLEK